MLVLRPQSRRFENARTEIVNGVRSDSGRWHATEREGENWAVLLLIAAPFAEARRGIKYKYATCGE